MNRVRVKLNSKGVREVLNSAGTQALLNHAAQQAAQAARSMSKHPAEFEADVQTGRTRAHGMVKAQDWAAEREQSKRDVLTKALGQTKV